MKDFAISVPGSKSITNRVLLLAAMSDGETVLKNVLISDDADYMRKALEDLGIRMQLVNGLEMRIWGNGGNFESKVNEIFLGNAGTAVRFLTAALATFDHEVIITGNERMRQRPIGPLVLALDKLGARVLALMGNDCPPISVCGPLQGGRARVKGDLSSQYFSALLMAAPYAKNDVEIVVEGDLVSKPYINTTLSCMKDFGVEAENYDYQRFIVKAGQRYKSCEYEIEGDASAATYFLGIGALTGARAEIKNVPISSIQGDVRFLDVLSGMGVDVGGDEKSIWARGRVDEKGFPIIRPLGRIDLNHIPDAAMTVALLAAFADGETEIVNVGNLRVKETDRIAALAAEMTKIGVDVDETDSGLVIRGKGFSSLNGAKIKTYDDHRMAMCFGMAGVLVSGIKVMDPGCVAKTFPEFWDLINSLEL